MGEGGLLNLGLTVVVSFIIFCVNVTGFSLGILKHASGTPCLAPLGVPE